MKNEVIIERCSRVKSNKVSMITRKLKFCGSSYSAEFTIDLMKNAVFDIDTMATGSVARAADALSFDRTNVLTESGEGEEESGERNLPVIKLNGTRKTGENDVALRCKTASFPPPESIGQSRS